MAVRSGFYRWLIPGALFLPAWLFVGWIISGASALSLLWVLISAPIVLVGQLILSLLVRARATAGDERAASWMDVGLIGGWNVSIIALGFFSNPWWWALFALTVLVGFGALWGVFAQLWREARPAVTVQRTAGGVGYIPPAPESPRATTQDEVFIIRESGTPGS